MKKLLILLLILSLCVFVMTSCVLGMYAELCALVYISSAYQYHDRTNWDCDTEEFVEKYHALYLEKIDYLKNKYALDCISFVERERDGDKFSIYLYCERYTLHFIVNRLDSYGLYDGHLYYYGDETGYGEYKDFKPMVDLLNDFTNYAAYDAETGKNMFEQLYYEALSNEDRCSNYEIYTREVAYEVLYSVDLAYRLGGYDYMLRKGVDLEKDCYYFRFEGLLKALP